MKHLFYEEKGEENMWWERYFTKNGEQLRDFGSGFLYLYTSLLFPLNLCAKRHFLNIEDRNKDKYMIVNKDDDTIVYFNNLTIRELFETAEKLYQLNYTNK